MTEDVVHVLVQPLQATVARPHVRVGGGHQALHCGLQAGQQLPVFPPEGKGKEEEEEEEEMESGVRKEDRSGENR